MYFTFWCQINLFLTIKAHVTIYNVVKFKGRKKDKK